MPKMRINKDSNLLVGYKLWNVCCFVEKKVSRHEINCLIIFLHLKVGKTSVNAKGFQEKQTQASDIY